MKGPLTEFPIVKTKVPGLTQKFDLSDLKERHAYFIAKAGPEIEKIKKYLEDNTFIAYLLGKKNSGKGTYTKLMAEIFGTEKIGHISVGDLVRKIYKEINEPEKREEIIDYLKQHYRGYISVEDAIDALIGKNQKVLLPTEFILALLKREIDKFDRKVIFIDGFPRDLDQVQYSLYFKDLANYRLDPDIFIAIDIPETVIDERMRNRVVCPTCQAPRNLTTLRTKEIGYDKDIYGKELVDKNQILEIMPHDVLLPTSLESQDEKADEVFLKVTDTTDLILLDLILPDQGGFQICRQIRGNRLTKQIPIIILSAKLLSEDITEALYIGADDYLTKPFSFDVLLARVRSLLRRSTARTDISVGDLVLDIVSHKATRGDRTIELTAREYSLLEHFMRHAGRLVTRMELARDVWGYDFDPGTNIVDVYVNHLRKKIDSGFARKLLHTERGRGYILQDRDGS